MAQTSHTSAASAAGATGATGEDGVAIAVVAALSTDINVAQLLFEAVVVLKKIEYHLSLITDTDLTHTEF